MRHKFLTASILAVTVLALVISSAAQKSQQNPQGETIQDESKPGMMSRGGMMGQGQGMMGDMMGQMRIHHQQMSELMNKLMQSMTAIRNEKDPAALKSKLAEHAALLKEMHDKMMQQGNMMGRMSGQRKTGCPMAGDVSKPPSE